MFPDVYFCPETVQSKQNLRATSKSSIFSLHCRFDFRLFLVLYLLQKIEFIITVYL